MDMVQIYVVFSLNTTVHVQYFNISEHIVSHKQISIKFGIGFYNKRVDLSAIESISVTKYPVSYGYGIKIPKGLLYNVSGRHAIKIKIRVKKWVILIGTIDWDNLKMILEESVKMNRN